MKKLLVSLLAFVALVTSCSRSSEEVWDDSRTASRHMARGVRALAGYSYDSRQVRNRDDFYAMNLNDEFIALQDDEGNVMVDFENVPQAHDLPIDPNTGQPAIHAFQDPANNQKLSGIFRNVQFPFDSDMVKGGDNIRTVENIVDYLRNNPNIYLYIEGHCDERGPELYNYALGTRRANAVRNLLVKEGVSSNRLFTVSYGKERPLVVGKNDETYALNRRAQFKIFTK